MKILGLFIVLLAICSHAISKKHKKSKSKSGHKNTGPIDDFVNPPNAVNLFNFRVTPKMQKSSQVSLDQSVLRLVPTKYY